MEMQTVVPCLQLRGTGEDCNYTGGASGFDNGEWRMYSWISAQAAGDAGMAHDLGAYLGDNAAMEMAMELGNTQINLCSWC